jgi:hypothetical protein
MMLNIYIYIDVCGGIADVCRRKLLCTFLGFVYILGFLYGNEVEMIELEIEDEEIRTR